MRERDTDKEWMSVCERVSERARERERERKREKEKERERERERAKMLNIVIERENYKTLREKM